MSDILDSHWEFYFILPCVSVLHIVFVLLKLGFRFWAVFSRDHGTLLKTPLSLVFPPMWLCLCHGNCTNWIWRPTKIVDEVCDEVWGKEDDMDWKKDFKNYLHNKYKKIFWLYKISVFDRLLMNSYLIGLPIQIPGQEILEPGETKNNSKLSQ